MNFQLTPLNRNIILAAVIVVIGFIAYFSTYQPKSNELKADQAQLQQLQQNYDDLKRVADEKPEYLALEHQIQSRLTGVELTADTRAYIPSYLKQIEALATHDGLTVTAVVPQPLPTPSGGPTPASTANPGMSAVSSIAPIRSAARVAGAEGGVSDQINNTAAATGEAGAQGQTQNGTPAPSEPGAVGASGTGVTSTTVTAGGGKPRASAATSARQNAIVYVNRSFQVVPVNMELSGTYAQLQTFLRDLNKFPKLIDVGDVTLTPSLQAIIGETPALHIVLPIKAYQLTAGPAGSQPAAAPATGNGG